MELKLDASKMMAELRSADAARPTARVTGIRVIGGAFVEALSVLSPRDTNRYVRGWLQAGQKAGVSGRALPALKRSKKHDDIVAALTEQVVAQQVFLRIKTKELGAYLLKRKGKPPGKKGDRLQAQIAAATARVDNAKDALKRFVGNDAAVAMLRKISYVLMGNQRHI